MSSRAPRIVEDDMEVTPRELSDVERHSAHSASRQEAGRRGRIILGGKGGQEIWSNVLKQVLPADG